MKNLLTITTLVFTLMFSSPSFAKWKKVTENVDGYSFYVDFRRIKNKGGFVYYWELLDRLKPNKYGDLSSKTYTQGDCMLSRVKYLSFSSHKEQMGGGTGQPNKPKNPEWTYPSPNSVGETILKIVCSIEGVSISL
jgi:hypothetical protein